MSIYDELLPTWNHPTPFDSSENFIGYKPTGYVIYSRNRESSILDNVNFDSILTDLGGESEHVQVIRHGHWACGWIEYITVSKSAPTRLLDQCVEIARALADYPVFCESAYSDAQYEAIHEHWDGLSMRDRIDLCEESRVSIFAARRDSVPDRVWEALSDVIY